MKKLYTIIIILFAVQISFSQETDSLVSTQPTDSLQYTRNYDELGTIVDRIPLADKDTLKITRWFGDWWFGASASVPFNQYFGEFHAATIYARPVNSQFNPEFEYVTENGFGYGFGLLAEYNPVTSRYGGFLNINYTIRTLDSETDIENESLELKYSINSSISYLELRPAFRYDITPSGFYAFIGPGVDIPISQEGQQLESFVNSGDIKEYNKFEYDDLKMRFYVHLGAGIDLFMADIAGTRVRFSPYFTADLGTTIVGKQNGGVSDSDIGLASARVGLSVKFGSDNRQVERLKFDPNYVGPDYDIAGIDNDVNLSGNLKDTTINSTDIAYYKKPEPEIIEEPLAEVEEREEPEVEENIVMETNRMKFFEFPTPAATDMTPRLQAYLNSVIRYMKNNPSSEIRVVGHSDNNGTPEQNQRRSVVRKDKVVRYLLSQGIDRYRILDRGEGDRKPIADSRTPEGRKKNRRVEITIVQ